MDTLENRISKPEYKAWLKAGLCLRYLKEGLVPFITRESEALYSDVYLKVRKHYLGAGVQGPIPVCNVCRAKDIKWNMKHEKWLLNCPNNVCNEFVEFIQEEHVKYPKPKGMFWGNCNPRKWLWSSWEVSKALMDKMEDGTAKFEPQDCDCSTLLKFIEYSKRCQIKGKISAPLLVKVRAYRNALMHSGSMELRKSEFEAQATDMISLLKSTDDYKTCTTAQAAVKSITTARDTDIEITTADISHILQEVGAKVGDMDARVDEVSTQVEELKAKMAEENEMIKRLESRLSEASFKADAVDKSTGEDIQNDGMLGVCGYILWLFSLVLTIVTSPLSLLLRFSIKAVQEGGRSFIFSLQRRLTPGGAKTPELSKLQRKLLEIYREKYSGVSVSPLDSTVVVPFDEVESEMVIIEEILGDSISRMTRRYRERPLLSFKDVFYDSQNIFVLSYPGRGKTTLCCRLANAWCQVIDSKQDENDPNRELELNDIQHCMRKFKYLFLLELHTLSAPMSIYEGICKSLLDKYPDLHEDVKEVTKHPEGILIICDGLDDYCDASPPRREEYFQRSTVLITSRPWEYEHSQATMDYNPDIVIRLKGLKTNKITNTIKSILSANDEQHDENTASKCFKDIEDVGLVERAKSPLLLSYFVHLWIEKRNLSLSLTRNVINLLALIIQRGEKTIGRKEELEENWIKARLPGKLNDETVLIPYGGLLLNVAKLAFEWLMLSKRKGRICVSYVVEDYLDLEEIEACLRINLLWKKKSAVLFHQKLFQYFFSAVWIVCSQEAYSKFRAVCRDVGSVLDMSTVYMFICGIAPDFGIDFSEHVSNVLQSDAIVSQWRECLMFDKVSHIKELTNLNRKCLQELGRSNPGFHITDMCIANECQNTLCLINAAAGSIVCIQLHNINMNIQEWQMLSKVVNESSSLQSVRLYSIHVDAANTEERTVPSYGQALSTLKNVICYEVRPALAPLLTCMKCITTLTHLQLRTIRLDKREFCELIKIIGQSGQLQILNIIEVKVQEDDEITALYASHANDIPTGLRQVVLTNLKMSECQWNVLFKQVSGSPLHELFVSQVSADHRGIISGSISISVLSSEEQSTISGSISIYPVQAKLWNVHSSLLETLACIEKRMHCGISHLVGTDMNDDVNVAVSNCISSGNSVTKSMLVNLELNAVEMRKLEWDRLVQIVAESASLKKLLLSRVHLSREDTTAVETQPDTDMTLPTNTTIESITINTVTVPLLSLLSCLETKPRMMENGTDVDCNQDQLCKISSLTLAFGRVSKCEWDTLVRIVNGAQYMKCLLLQNIQIKEHPGDKSLDLFRGLGTTIQSSSSLSQVTVIVSKDEADAFQTHLDGWEIQRLPNERFTSLLSVTIRKLR